MIFLRKARLPQGYEAMLLTITHGSRNFSDLHNAIRQLARKSTSDGGHTFLDYTTDADDQETEYASGDGESDEDYEDYVDYDSEDGELILMADDDLDEIFDEDELEEALANFDRERKRFKSGKANRRPGGYQKARTDLNNSRKGRGFKLAVSLRNRSKSRDRSSTSQSNKGGAVSPPPKPHSTSRPQSKPRSRMQLRSRSKLESQVKCRICDKVGHFGRNCPKNQQGNRVLAIEDHSPAQPSKPAVAATATTAQPSSDSSAKQSGVAHFASTHFSGLVQTGRVAEHSNVYTPTSSSGSSESSFGFTLATPHAVVSTHDGAMALPAHLFDSDDSERRYATSEDCNFRVISIPS